MLDKQIINDIINEFRRLQELLGHEYEEKIPRTKSYIEAYSKSKELLDKINEYEKYIITLNKLLKDR